MLDNADLRAAMMMYVGDEGVSVVDRGRADKGTSSGVDFSNCSLKGATFGSAKLDGADFSGALLTGANFRNARLSNAKFKDAVLAGVSLNDLGVPSAALAGAVTDVTPEAAAKFARLKAELEAHQQWIGSAGAAGKPANFDNEDLRPLQKLFVGRPLSGLSARARSASGSISRAGQLQAAKFDGADLRDADFTNADLRGASLRAAKLAHARFDKTNLGGCSSATARSFRPT